MNIIRNLINRHYVLTAALVTSISILLLIIFAYIVFGRTIALIFTFVTIFEFSYLVIRILGIKSGEDI